MQCLISKSKDSEPDHRSGTSSIVKTSSASSIMSLRSIGDKNQRVNSRTNEAFTIDCHEMPVRSRTNSARLENNWTENGNVCKDSAEEGLDESEPRKGKEGTGGLNFSLSAFAKAKQLARKLAEKHQKEGDIHMIDKLCRILFPITFIVFNIIYFVIVMTSEQQND